jgi:acetyl-CoA carboxylase carboxyltransferase component
MVGPESEKTALVRHSSRVFVTAASLEVPFLTVVIRKSYGLGAMAMAGGGFRVPFFGVSWPTGEFGGMGLEGSVKLGYRKELEAIENLEERRQLYDDLVAKAYEHGKALSSAMNFEIDDVIDPFDTRKWIVAALESMRPPTSWRKRKKSRFIDTW